MHLQTFSSEPLLDALFLAQEKKNKKDAKVPKATEEKDDTIATQNKADENAIQAKSKHPEDKKEAKPKSNWLAQTAPDETDAATSRSKSRGKSGEFEEVIEESPSSGVTLLL